MYFDDEHEGDLLIFCSISQLTGSRLKGFGWGEFSEPSPKLFLPKMIMLLTNKSNTIVKIITFFI